MLRCVPLLLSNSNPLALGFEFGEVTSRIIHLYLVSLVELCRLIFRSFSLAKIVFYPNNKFPFMLPSHNCIIITMFSFQGTSWALSQETQWNIIFMMLQSISLVESTGIEPVTSCLQGRRSPSWANPPNKRFEWWAKMDSLSCGKATAVTICRRHIVKSRLSSHFVLLLNSSVP